MALDQLNNPMMQKIDQAMLSNPQIGDVYEVGINTRPGEVREQEYTLVKVEKSEGEAVTLRVRNNGITGKFPPMYKELVKHPGDYGEKTLVVRKKRLVDEDLCPTSGSTCFGSIYATKRP